MPEPEPTPEAELTEEEKAEAESKAAALEAKGKGNTAYKARKFEEAISHYNEALELYDKDITFLTNRAAVYFEMGNYEQCVKDCDEAYEKGRELHVDYGLLGKALTRKGGRGFLEFSDDDVERRYETVVLLLYCSLGFLWVAIFLVLNCWRMQL